MVIFFGPYFLFIFSSRFGLMTRPCLLNIVYLKSWKIFSFFKSDKIVVQLVATKYDFMVCSIETSESHANWNKICFFPQSNIFTFSDLRKLDLKKTKTSFNDCAGLLLFKIGLCFIEIQWGSE